MEEPFFFINIASTVEVNFCIYFSNPTGIYSILAIKILSIMDEESGNVKLHTIGNGDAFGSGGHFQTCFYVHSSNYHFLVDCGATSLVAMKRQQISPSSIDTILLTHLHGDHYGGLPFFLLDAHFIQQRTRPLTIVGPKGTEEKVFDAMALFYPGVDINELSYPIHFITFIDQETIQVGPLDIKTFPVSHAEGSNPHGFRIGFEGKVLAFSGDTSWNDILYKIADQADIFVCECNFFATRNDNHIHYLELMEKIDGLHCKKIVLNHLSEEMLLKKEDVKIAITEEGQSITV